MLDMHDVLCYIAAVERGKPRALIVSDGRIAQLVEQLTLNQRVQGSSPCAPTIGTLQNQYAVAKGHSPQGTFACLSSLWGNAPACRMAT